MSPKEALELKMIESKIWFDKSIGKWRVSYPFLQDPRVLSNNYRRVLKMSISLEGRVARAGLVSAANEVFDKMVALGALEEISPFELQMWNGAVHYLPIQLVVNMESRTTPVRLVTNSSLVDPATGLSLNGILAKGPMTLNDLWSIFVRFRNQEVGLIGDLSKAYYQMVTGPVEKHVRRVLWRSGEVGTPWRIYGFRVVSMGDCPAACLMTLTMRGTADMSKEIDMVASQKLGDDSYVDDITTGGTEEECARFKGNEDLETCKCDGTIPRIMKSGGYDVKAMAKSGEPNGLALDKLGATVFGMGFSTVDDMMEVKFKVNITPAKRGKPTGPDLNIATLGQLEDAEITKRICLRVTNSQYDMVGIATPLIIQLRACMKDLYSPEVGWDKPLVGKLREQWVKYFEMLVRVGGVKFKRATRPKNTVGQCILVCYFDGSNSCYAIAIYARWVLENGSVVVNLLASKARVAPMFTTSTPRMEMDGATLLARVVYRVVLALLDDPPGRVYFCGDSETVLACREKESGFFGEFFGNRIGEQMDNQEKIEEIVRVGEAGEWYHVPSADNAADRPSRLDSSPDDLGLDSEWLCGPAYLKEPVEQWPLNRHFADKKSKVKVPMEEVRRKYRSKVDAIGDILKGEYVEHEGRQDDDDDLGGPGSLDNYVLKLFGYGEKTNDWRRLISTTSYLFYWAARVKGDSARGAESRELVARDLATTFWLRVAMPDTNKAALEGRLKHLSPMQHPRYPDMLVVVGRAAAGLRHHFQKDFLPILISGTRTSYLVMLWAHNEDHGGVDVSFQTSLQVAWIVGGRSLARGIKKSCIRCRYLARMLEGQQMAVLPDHLSVPSPCFTFVAVDLAGPFVCKKEGASKATRRNTGTMKVWAVLVVCLQTKAVRIYMVGGLGTEDFLLAWDSFEADHGQPMVAYGDRGTNLVSASKEGGVGDVPAYDWDSVVESTRGKTEWHFHPAQSQHRNGAVESFVKKFKRSLVHKFGDRLMFMLELQSCFKVVASILNSRPLYARWGPRGGDDPDYLSPLTPNMLLTGRANVELPVKNYVASDKPLYRLQYVEECVSQWWQQFMSQNFSSLVPRQKWFSARRNMCVGDIVLIQYEGKSKPGSYRLGVVIAVEKDPDGLVRTVSVEYSLLSELPAGDRLLYKGVTKKRIRAPVQRLVLILPVEERNLDCGVDGGQDCLPGGQAVAAPHEEVVHGIGQELGDGLQAEQGTGASEGQGEGLHEGAGVQADVVDDCQHREHAQSCVPHTRDRQDPGKAFVTGCIRRRLEACDQMERDFPSKDFEAALYLQFCERFDWSKVDEVNSDLKEVFERKQGDV